MVQCEWGDCTERMHVDYICVKHWGTHIRDHIDDLPNVVQCQWGGVGVCGISIHKSSLWKHIVVHQRKFKIRCPLGCSVFTRGDMMKRHLNSCMFKPRRAWARFKNYVEDELFDGDDEET